MLPTPIRSNAQRPFAIIVTHLGLQDRLPEFPWLEKVHPIDESTSIILARETWNAIAAGDPAVWDEFERKLMISSYIHEPSLLAIVGHAGKPWKMDAVVAAHEAVARIVRRIRSCGLPGEVLGFLAGASGQFKEMVEPGHGPAWIEEETAVL